MTSASVPRPILDTVRAFTREHQLLQPGPLVVAVSGGPDSVALLFILAELAPEQATVLHVAHFDHRTRRTAAQDAQLVSDLAGRAGATIRIGRAERRPKSEDEARRARYAFLRRVAADLGASAVATGHTRDDQAETVLLHLTRGSGISGLAAMRPSRDGIVRPLLSITREDTTAVCAALGVAPIEDPTNRSLRFARNRIRHRVLPQLAAINPQVTLALARLADAAAAAADARHERATALLAAASHDRTIALDALGEDADLREEALAMAWEGDTGVSLSARQRSALASEAARRDGSTSLDLPGGRALREYGALRIEAATTEAGRAQDEVDTSVQPLALGKEVEWGSWRFRLGGDREPVALRDHPGAPEGNVPSAATQAAFVTTVPADQAEGLTIRARRPGDRMAAPPHGKVQDLLVDAKVPARLRGRMPVIATTDGSIGWIPGVARAWESVGEGILLRAWAPTGMRDALRALPAMRGVPAGSRSVDTGVDRSRPASIDVEQSAERRSRR